MAFTQISSTNIQPNTVVDYATYSELAGTLAPKITSVNVANSAFSVLDDTAVNIGGGYIVVTGQNFATDATVLVDTTQASAVTRVSSTQLRVQLPAKSAATYNLYVVNPDGGTGIRVNGVTYSSDPTWVTASPLPNQAANNAFGVNFSATSATSYSVASGSTLPAGTQLLANGYFYGTVSISSETTYSFVIRATDAELQEADKTFGVTVTVIPTYKLWLWGRGANGGLGLNDTSNRSSPVQVGTNTTWSANTSAIAGGTDMGFAIKTDGTLWSWGSNSYGGLGLNDAVARSSPTQVGASTNWSKIATHGNFSLATKTDGTLWSWGINLNGQLGTNSVVYRSSPTQVGADTTWLKITTGNYNSVAIKTDGTLWAWGNGQRLPHNNTFSQSRSSPVLIGSYTDWADVAGGANIFLALKTNGTIWSWGNNYQGALGLNAGQQDARSSPTQVGADTNWSSIAMGEHVASAIKTNGTLWSWGQNESGQLGINSVVYRSSPTQVGADTTWLKITNSYSQMAIKTNGTLWTWGKNNFGQLGLNDTANKSSPVQIGTNTNWSNITNGAYTTLALTAG
jgi:alpha-tubulin suppressor-like RCC1 family protein